MRSFYPLSLLVFTLFFCAPREKKNPYHFRSTLIYSSLGRLCKLFCQHKNSFRLGQLVGLDIDFFCLHVWTCMCLGIRFMFSSFVVLSAKWVCVCLKRKAEVLFCMFILLYFGLLSLFIASKKHYCRGRMVVKSSSPRIYPWVEIWCEMPANWCFIFVMKCE